MVEQRVDKIISGIFLFIFLLIILILNIVAMVSYNSIDWRSDMDTDIGDLGRDGGIAAYNLGIEIKGARGNFDSGYSFIIFSLIVSIILLISFTVLIIISINNSP